jgi:signal transduction histidine kinase
VKLKISIYSRLVFWITLLVFSLFGAVLVVTQISAGRILSDDMKNRAELQARYLADANFLSLMRADREAIQKSVDAKVGGDILYIVFYDRDGEPFAADATARADEEILRKSHFAIEDATRADPPYSEFQRIQRQGASVRIREVELLIFPQEGEVAWGSVKVGVSVESLYTMVRRVRNALLPIAAGGVLLGILGAAILARRISRPLHRLAEGTVRISRGDFSQGIVDTSGDEVGDLARSFNEMTRQLLHARERMEEANRQLVQHEKLASIGRMSATIAHEIRNPLTSVKLNIQKVAEEERTTEADKAHFDLALEGIDQIERFIKELLNFTRVPELSLEKWPVEQIVEESLKLVKDVLAEKGIVVERACAEGLPPVIADGDKLRQVFLNILRNAHEALGSGGKISISCDAVESGGRKMIRVRIADNGPGIPDKDRPNIFEPFFTTKPTGFGLGLANARKIVEQHNGTISVGRKRGRGSAFVVLIPAEEAS